MQAPQLWSRRNFLTAAASLGAAMVINPFSAWALEDIDPKVAAIVARTMGIDTHNLIDVPLEKAELPGPKIELAAEMKKTGLAAICMTFAVDYQKLTFEGQAYERFNTGLDAMDTQLLNNGIKRALNLADLQQAHQKKQPIVIQSVEGGHFLEGNIERLSLAYQRGLRHLTLLHDNDASVPLGDVFTNPPQWGGLTAFGAEVIKECNRLGILVDLGHASTATVGAALKVAQHPVIVSQAGLDTQLGNNPGFAKMMKPRLISKEQAKFIAQEAGVIGVWTHLADTAAAYAQNIRAMVDVAGIDHVCLGTDTKLTPDYRKPGTENGGRPWHGTNQTWANEPYGFYYAVVAQLLDLGFHENDIAKIGGLNFCRIFDLATSKKH